jgi:hypothetical protein
MKRLLWTLLFAPLLIGQALAADNTLLVTPCAAGCITTKSKDVGAGVQAAQPVISDVSGNPITVLSAGADTVTNATNGLQTYNFPLVFNGTTWDRLRGDATNGAFVNIKTSVALAVTQSGTWSNRVTDGTNTAAVKATTTAAAAADPSLVTNESPNSQLSTATGAIADSAYAGSGSTTIIGALKGIYAAAVSAIIAGTNRIGYVTDDPCDNISVKVNVPISQTANTKIISATSAKKNYICHILLIGADAENLSIVEGTGTVCATGTAAMIGGTTAANGTNLAANGGYQAGGGRGSITFSTGSNVDVCLFQSGGGRVAGNIIYAQQ